jgi:hypothetical protein
MTAVTKNSGFSEEDLNVIFYQNMPNLHNLYKLAETTHFHVAAVKI